MVTITLRNLSSNEDNRVSIAVAGAIPQLVALLRNGTARTKRQATETLCSLSYA